MQRANIRQQRAERGGRWLLLPIVFTLCSAKCNGMRGTREMDTNPRPKLSYNTILSGLRKIALL
jgi:hypothetical protein